MDADLSDEEFLLPADHVDLALSLPSLAQDLPFAKPAANRQSNYGIRRTLGKVASDASARKPAFGKFSYTGSSTGSLSQGRRKADTIPIGLPSSDKPARPKRLHSNAQIFDDSEGENSTDSDLDQPVAKRLRQMPAEKEEWQVIPEPDIIYRRRRIHVPAGDTTTDKEANMIQQLEEAGEEVQENDMDAVLQRCEQLSLKLRDALQTQGTDRCPASDTVPSALISHATLVAACGEAAKSFKPYQV